MISQGRFLTNPVAIVPGPGGTMLVSDPDALDLTGGVFWIDRDGNQTPILCGVDDVGVVLWTFPQEFNTHSQAFGPELNPGDLYVTGLKTHDGNFGVGRVTHVDARTGIQTMVAEGGYLVRPEGITVEANGQLIV